MKHPFSVTFKAVLIDIYIYTCPNRLHHPALHTLTHQITTLIIWRYTVVSLLYSIWCCLLMSWGVCGRVLVYLGGILGCQSYFGSLWGLKQTHHFGTTLKCNIFSTILRHQNTKPLHKNHWVGLGWPIFAFFRFVRDMLFVTVAFDHPVHTRVKDQRYINIFLLTSAGRT